MREGLKELGLFLTILTFIKPSHLNYMNLSFNLDFYLKLC